MASGDKQAKKNGFNGINRTADQPGQTLNVDLCFVPFSHPADLKLPAVSGSSGHLVIERLKDADGEPENPGKVFADAEMDYSEAMQAFVQASKPLSGGPKEAGVAEDTSQKAEIQQLRQKENALSIERRGIRKSRELEDAAWKATREAHRAAKDIEQPKTRAPWGSRKGQTEQQRNLREQHRQQKKQRQQEDEQWRLDRKNLREQISLIPIVTDWIAILVITDNCTRQCLGLPIFVAGSHVTAEMVVTALRVLLPAHLQFLISDRGVHFTAEIFRQLAKEADFVHVVITRHRPQSNGIAERFVRTLKEWLADKAWISDKGLSEFVRLFLLEYNNRPHQGLPIHGLSPNEYASRIWLI